MNNKLKNFYSIIRKLKLTKRSGWINRGLNADSISDHVYGAMSIGWKLANEENVDTNKVIELLLIHDWIMSVVPDVTPVSGKYDEKKDMEENAKSKIVKVLGKKLGQKYLKLFDEFNKQSTMEAKIAREADKLETLLQGDAFEKEANKNDVLDEFLKTYSSIFSTKTGKELFDEIVKDHSARKE